jgi:tetratricopeptide (TPR) repeat protein
MTAENFWHRITDRASGFYTNNRKVFNITGISVVVIAGLIVFWSFYWHPQREQEAALKLSKLHHYFETDSFAVVVNGIKGKKMATAPQIADDYGFTAKGREAALMAGLSYMKLAKWDKAVKYLDKAKADDMILGPSILAAKATCYAELGKVEKAAETYEKAGKLGDNLYTAVYYRQAGIHYEKAGNLKAALRCYETIQTNYKSAYGQDQSSELKYIEQDIYKVKGLLGELNN